MGLVPRATAAVAVGVGVLLAGDTARRGAGVVCAEVPPGAPAVLTSELGRRPLIGVVERVRIGDAPRDAAMGSPAAPLLADLKFPRVGDEARGGGAPAAACS
mmetsp:Transcript_50894/g.90500  ORF Transcript_50894/g.90500 Transcript_50894/m.90500 type:complete len:102 (+) Transcript_50894:301-606(+)